MTETNHNDHLDIQPSVVADEEQASRAEAIVKANEFLSHEIPYLGRLTGLDVDFQIGESWATDLKTGNFTIDPSFFVEREYTPDHAVYATLHELWAHVRDIKRDPRLAAREIRFSQKGKAEQLFMNILSDIHGNKLMHHVLPAMKDTAANLYDTKLFPLVGKDGVPVDYSVEPLHIQFMYKMIRDEMIPDSDTPVRPEVEEALASLRNYKDSGDVIKYLTDPNSKLPGVDRFEQQLAVIYPLYRQLLEQSKQEDEASKGGSGKSDSQSDESQSDQSSQEGGQPSDEQQSGSGKSDDPFSKAYEDYFENKHPEPFSEEEQSKLNETLREAIKKQADQDKPINPKSELDKQLRQETGFGLDVHSHYKAEVAKNLDAINRMRDVFRSVINERVSLRRGLSRRPYTEGAILDPDRLAQTIIDTKSGVHQPEAFKRYESKRGRTETVGNTDYIFVFDRSDSMSGENAQAAASSAIIMLEGLAVVERDVKEAEAEYNLNLDLDIRTALYLFNDEATCLKALGGGLSDHERLGAQHEIVATSGGTADYLALEEIVKIPKDADRQRIIIVVSDGESNDPAQATAAIRRLREQGALIYGIGIGSDAATDLYKPYAQRIDTPASLPDVLESFIKETI